MKKIASLFKIFKSNFSDVDSYENLLTNKKLVATEKTLSSQKARKGPTYHSFLKNSENIKITIEEKAINESLKSRYRKQKRYPIDEILNPVFSKENVNDLSHNGLELLALDPAVIEKIYWVDETSTNQWFEEYFLHYISLREEVKSELITKHIYRALRNSLSKAYKEIQSEFNQIPLKFSFFEFFDQLFSLKRCFNLSSEIIKALFIENIIKNQNDRKIYRPISTSC